MILQVYKLPVMVATAAAGLLGTVVLAQQPKNAAPESSNPVQDRPVIPQDQAPAAAQPKAAVASADQKNHAVHQHLALLIDAEFPNGVELQDLLKLVKQETTKAKPPGLPIYVDPIGLQEAELSLSSKVIVNLKQRPVGVVLRSALRSVGLACRVKAGFLMIESETDTIEDRLDEIDRKLELIMRSLARLEAVR
jgi:hypothetical protein